MAQDENRPLRADARRNRARVLLAAEEVFAESGPSASTEEVARRAGVAIGTVFRHFPTKEDLVQAVFAERVQRLVDEAETLSTADDPAAAFFTFFTHLTELSVTKYAFADTLAAVGVDVTAVGRTHPQVVGRLHAAIDTLLTNAQRAGAVRADVRVPEVVTMMIGVSRAAEHAGSDRKLLTRVLTIIFDGLRPSDRS
ncbi:TetR/AcrR family transcriptional regulator [Nonomuraea sp. ZG12]|uniref:TetR/AcrR family transcriptional regulator n=1 Tax=Nonomuraea sp. ZG12 TaxID=3452207 RepID=UPI003F8993A3